MHHLTNSCVPPAPPHCTRQMDAPLRWRWLVAPQRNPWAASLLALRKRLVYACLTIANPNGRNRLLTVRGTWGGRVCTSRTSP